MPTSVRRPRPMDNRELVEGLCEASVPLREARRLHLESYGTLIPHVFMAEVLKHIGGCLGMGGQHLESNRPELERVMVVIERGMAEGDRETRNVNAISFARDSELELFFDQLQPMLGPRTRAELNGK